MPPRSPPSPAFEPALAHVYTPEEGARLGAERTDAGQPRSHTGNSAGQHAIWINDQWRICFRWHDGNAVDVEIVDDHDEDISRREIEGVHR